ncbi:phage head closure protein [Bradyrhizobium prioriisuperbiae]|uniref:phage head closure protein n=1 Tax=Bradyrhizobium prioriisuperbiae TaxID=2854389 RepID=UPI0028F00875|nr:phage head closure protein [Bradyrhizobium prioritasuperba]
MRAGPANKRATFQLLQTVPDGAGGGSESWVDHATVWARFSPENAKEKIQQGRIADAAAGTLWVRSSDAMRQVNDTFRVLLDGKTFNVRSVANPDQRNKDIVMIIETDGSTPS